MLILDDDHDVGKVIQVMAESLGVEAEFITDSNDFFDQLDKLTPDIVIIDLSMPKFDGIEIIRLLAARNCRAKIIISSGVGSANLDAARRLATRQGLDVAGVLPKPISRDAFRLLVG
jgi:CheY-like chemotaxis protein